MILPKYSSSLQLGATFLFFCAVFHTFLTPSLAKIYQEYQHKKMVFPERWKRYLLLGECFRLLSKIELVFIFWAVPLFFLFLWCEGYKVTMGYFNSRNYLSALFIMVMLILLESKPIEYFSECVFSTIAKIGRQSPKCWWWTLMIAAPLSSFFLKETGAMIIASTLLVKHFYRLFPSTKFGYATMGLLFSNISISGLLSAFSSRALFMILPSVKWGNTMILQHFCWKAVLAILISTSVCYWIFRKEFDSFPAVSVSAKAKERIPKWVICTHIGFVAALMILQSEPLFMGALFVFYLAFQNFTVFYQHSINLAKIAFVGLFFVGLVVFGGLQEWWVLEVMHRMSDFGYLITAYILSISLDNALVNYIVHNLPVATDCYLYLVLSGCMSAGGLTLIANMPNIVGYLILKPSFPSSSFSLGWLFLAALGPSCISVLIFWLLKNVPEFSYCFFR